MQLVIVAFAAVLVAGLTLFSGFDSGTLLMPVFALFYPIEKAVATTAIVYGANNIFKIAVVGKYADKTVVVRFGVPAIIAAFVGATALGYVSHFDEIARHSLGSRTTLVTPIKLTMGKHWQKTFAKTEAEPPRQHCNAERSGSKRKIKMNGFSVLSQERRGRNDKTLWGQSQDQAHRVLC